MRRELQWGLGITLLATAVAMVVPDKSSQLVNAVARNDPSAAPESRRLENARVSSSAAAMGIVELPRELPVIALAPARRDPFGVMTQVPPAMPKPFSPVAIVPVVAPMPVAPALNLRYWGRMMTPEGKQLTYLARGETVFPVAEGDRLEDGWTVVALKEDAVLMLYPPLDFRASVPIAPPKQN
jgi:hypothetical protein